jgi:hypothetical protein
MRTVFVAIANWAKRSLVAAVAERVFHGFRSQRSPNSRWIPPLSALPQFVGKRLDGYPVVRLLGRRVRASRSRKEIADRLVFCRTMQNGNPRDSVAPVV